MIRYFKGFNGLRFLAAFLVLLSHSYQSVVKQNFELSSLVHGLHIWNSGPAAVDFFFTLSGFLITYLLIKERKESKDISIKNFYLRRVFRIWPLYFLIFFIGIAYILVVFPKLNNGQDYIDPASLPYLVLMYIFFLPNLASSLYKVGMIYPLWSIGVEEQFYLIWAPLIKFLKGRVFIGAVILFLISLFIYLGRTNFETPTSIDKFLTTLRFNYMSIGAIFAVVVNKYGITKIEDSFISKPIFRAFIPFLILLYLNLNFVYIDYFILNTICAILYGSLLLQVFTAKKYYINLESKVFIFLGKISYGIYMFHLVIDNLLRAISLKLNLNEIIPYQNLYLICYTIILLFCTVFISYISFEYFESYFLKIKNKYSHK